MTNILVYCSELIASVRVGVLEPLKFFEDRGDCTVRYKNTNDVRTSDLNWCDTLICVRGLERSDIHIIDAAKKAGCFVAYFLDDDLEDVPEEYEFRQFADLIGAGNNMRTILGKVDVLWGVNRLLLDKYGKWCKRTVLLRVPITVEDTVREYRETVPFNVLYAGSADHKTTVQTQISPAIRRLNADFPGRFEFTFIGADPNLPDQKNVKFHSYFESYNQYLNFVRGGNYTLGLAPLQDGFFYRCKHYNKFLEYARLHIPCVFTKTEPYTLIVKEHENGFFSDGSPESWYDQILYAFEHQRETFEAGERAFGMLKTEFSAEKIAEELTEEIPELFIKQTKYTLKWYDFIPKIIFYSDRVKFTMIKYGGLGIFVIPYKAVRKVIRSTKRRLSE